MNLSITKMSPNGQIVIPSEIRKKAKIKPATKFLVITEGKDILLKQMDEKRLLKEIRLVENILEAEEQIKKGQSLVVDGNLSAEEIDKVLMSQDVD